MGTQMKRKELTKTFIMIWKWKQTFGLMFYLKVFQRNAYVHKYIEDGSVFFWFSVITQQYESLII